VSALVVDAPYQLGRALATASAYGLLGKDAPPYVIGPAATITKANLVRGYRNSLHIPPPKSVMDALK